MSSADELYVLARTALLDALEALTGHHDALILVGAQAIYLRIGEGDLAVAPYTTDGDLAIDPAALADIPPLEQQLTAGPAALLVAKMHKIADRQGTSRHIDKDALDVVRILRGISTDDLATRFEGMLRDSRSAEAAQRGRALFEQLFLSRAAPAIQMAVRALGPLDDGEVLAASARVLGEDLLRLLG